MQVVGMVFNVLVENGGTVKSSKICRKFWVFLLGFQDVDTQSLFLLHHVIPVTNLILM